LPSSSPAAANTNAPVQTEPKRLALGATAHSHRRKSSRAIAAFRPREPPATSKVSGWPPILRLWIATPELDVTAPPSGDTMTRS
jgi:hypothetical protein